MDENTHHQTPPPQLTPPPVMSPIRIVEKISAWVLILSAVVFALVAILSIWQVFGTNNDVAWKALASIIVIMFAALVINIGARIYDGKKK